MAAEYDVFLSHDGADKAAVGAIAVRLRDAGLRPFFDEWHLVPGDLRIPALEAAIEGSPTIAVLIGPTGVEGWHDQQKQLALVLAAEERGKRVIPVLLTGANRQSLKGFLGLRTGVDFDEGDGFRRLVAGILGQTPELVAEPGAVRRWTVLAKVQREIIDFTLERNRHKHFFGREGVLAEMDAWVAERDSGWLLVTGSPGLGKSALMDRWLRRRESAGSLTAFHFIRRGYLDWAEPQVVQRNLAAQIEVMFPEQRDAEAVPTYRLEQLLARVSPVLAERSERLVLLVDGLDEAMEQGKDNPIPYLFPIEVPGRVFVVAASRPQYPHLGWIDRRTGPRDRLDLDARMVSNEHAVRRYWETLGPQMSPPLSTEQQRAAIQGAQGNLLHAVKLHELWSKTSVVRSPDVVPQGLEGMLDELWERIGRLSDEDNARAEDGLSLLCAARESLPLVVVESLLGWRQGSARRKFLPFAREMLLEDAWGGIEAYRPFHEGLRELVERELPDAVRHHHETLAEYAAWPVEGDEFRRSYALRHRVEHRVEAGQVDAAAKACMDVGYLTAKACAEGVVAVERDIRIAVEAQEDDERRERLTTLGRLVAASAHWVSKVPEALPALLYDRALTNAPELLADWVGSAHTPSEHPKLRHALRPRAMSRILGGHQSYVMVAAVLPNGRVVSGSQDNTLRVWDVDTGRTLATLEGHHAYVMAVAVLADGRVVSGSQDNTLRVWDVDTGRTLATLEGHEEPVRAVAVLADGRVVSGSLDRTLRVWDIDTGCTLATLHGHQHSVTTVAVLPDGRVVSGSKDNTLRVWDVDTGRALAILHGHQYSVTAVAVLPDGRVVSGSEDETLRVWDVDTGRTLATLEGHQEPVWAVAVLPDGRVVSGSSDNTLRVWDVDTNRTLTTLHGHQHSVNVVAALANGRIVSGSSDNTLRVWDVDPGRTLATLQGGQHQVNAVAVLPNGCVVSGSDDHTLRVWDVDTGRTLATLQGHHRWVNAVAVLPDGRVVSGSSDYTLRVWDIEAGRTLATLQGHRGRVSAVVVLPDGRVVSGSSDHTLRVWNIDTGRTLATLQGHQDGVRSLAVLPDGRVISGSWDDTLCVWDVDTGHWIATLQGHHASVNAVAVLPNGLAVSGSDDKTLRVWDVDTGRTLVTLQGHQDSVRAVVVLPDGRIVSGSDDKTLRVWDIDSGNTIATVYGDDAFRSIAAIDEHLIVAGDAFGDVWFIDLPELPPA